MNNIGYVLRVQLLSAFGINKLLHTTDPKEKKKAIWMGIGIGLLAIMIIGMSILYNILIAVSFKEIELVEFYLPMVMSLTSFIILITTFYKAKGILFEGKDYDMLLALPIKTSHIVGAQVLYLYLMNLLFLVMIMIPAGFVYGILVRPRGIFYLIYGMTLFFVPLIPIILATFVGAIITMITMRLKHTNFITLMINVVFIAVVICMSFGANSISEEHMGQLGEVVMSAINKIYPLAQLYLQAVCEYSIGAALLFIGLSVLAFGLFVTFIGRKFKIIHTMLQTSARRSQYEGGQVKESSVLGALYYKELKRYFSSSLYVMNTSVGIIFMLILSVSLFFLDAIELEHMLGINGVHQYIAEFAPLIASFCIALNCTTACAISLEGKNLWILKSSPIEARTIFISKIGVQLAINIPAILLNTILMTIALRAHFMQALLIFAIPTVYTIFIAIMGIIINLKWPNLEWSNEVAVIKQSMATLLVMVVGLISIIVPGVLVIIIPGVSTIMKLIMLLVVMIVLIYGAYRYMVIKGDKLFRDL